MTTRPESGASRNEPLMSSPAPPYAGRSVRGTVSQGNGRSGERDLAEQLVDPPQVTQPRLGAAAAPAADGLHRDAQLARRGLDREAFPAQHAGHPFGERRRWRPVTAGL